MQVDSNMKEIIKSQSKKERGQPQGNIMGNIHGMMMNNPLTNMMGGGG